MPAIVRPTKPELDDDCWIYLTAFYDLSTCRSIGSETVGDIPYTAILTWLTYWKISEEERAFFLDIIPRLDRVYLAHVYKKREESLEKANRGKSKGLGTGTKTVRRTRR